MSDTGDNPVSSRTRSRSRPTSTNDTNEAKMKSKTRRRSRSTHGAGNKANASPESTTPVRDGVYDRPPRVVSAPESTPTRCLYPKILDDNSDIDTVVHMARDIPKDTPVRDGVYDRPPRVVSAPESTLKRRLYPKIVDDKSDIDTPVHMARDIPKETTTRDAVDGRLYPSLRPSGSSAVQAGAGKLNKTQSGAEYAANNCWFWFILVVIIIACITVLLYVLYMPHIGHNSAEQFWNNEQLLENLRTKFKNFKQTFPGQSERFWNVTYAPIRSVTANRSPDQPAIILLAAPPGAHDVVDKIAGEVAASYPQSSQPPVNIHASQFEGTTQSDSKEQLDINLGNALGGESKSVVIFNLEKLPPDSILIFHKYCDHETAPFKNAVIVFTVHLPDSFNSDDSIHRRERSVEDFLISNWLGRGSDHDMDQDKLGALLSRIANSIAIATSKTAELSDQIVTLRKNYAKQSTRFWSVIHAALWSVAANPNPKQPAIIMLAVTPNTHDDVINIAINIANVFSPTKNSVEVINGAMLTDKSPDHVKEKIDTEFDSALRDESKSVVLTNIEQLPPESLLIFYKYCDHETALYKDTVLVFTVSLPGPFDEKQSDHEREEMVEEFLRTKWMATLDENTIAALLSRIANSVAIVT